MGQAKEVEVVSDAELIGAAREGDAASLGLLLERHRAPLYGLALGTEMLSIAREQARERVLDALSLLVFEQNTGAVKLYEGKASGKWTVAPSCLTTSSTTQATSF